MRVSLPTRQREEIVRILKQRQMLLAEQTEIENYLSVNIDETVVGNKFKKVITLTTEVATVAEQYRLAQELANSKHAAYEELQRQQLKVIEKAVDSLEGATETKRIVTYAGYTLEVLAAYKIRLQETKTKNLALTMTNCFKQISSKKDLINEIKIDPKTLDFLYLY